MNLIPSGPFPHIDRGRTWWLASPFTRFRPGLPRPLAWRMARDQAAAILAVLEGFDITTFSPIVVGYAIGEMGFADHGDQARWDRWCDRHMPIWQGCIVADTMDGWLLSAGVVREIAGFADRGLPVVMLSGEGGADVATYVTAVLDA